MSDGAAGPRDLAELADLDDHALAARVARDAGRLLLELRAGGGEARALRAAGDARADELILRALAQARPDDAVLSEESADDLARLGATRVWIVDPLDGTREFGEAGRADWAVHVALVEGGRPTAGAVALPARGLVLGTRPAAALAPRVEGPIRLAASRTRPPAVAEQLAQELGGVLVPMGSAGAKAMAVVLGEADAYVHAGGQYEWDSAAPVAVGAAAALHVSRLDGSPLVYNRPDPWLPDLLVCRPELREPLTAALARLGTPPRDNPG